MLHDMHDAPTAISPEFTSQVPDIVAALSDVVDDVPLAGRQWVFYGSLPLGAGREGSDLDAMLLHDAAPGPAPHRRDATWDGRPVTVYVLSHQDLVDDARERRFGGYFALKLFSPSCTDVPERAGALAEAAARFLGTLGTSGGFGVGPWTADQLLARAYLAFVDLYPGFGSYIARLAREPGLMGRVWAHQRAEYVGALRSTGRITSVGEDLWRHDGQEEPLDEVRDRCTARFWAFGAVCHGADAGFPDLYYAKADARASRTEQDAALGLLHGAAAAGMSC